MRRQKKKAFYSREVIPEIIPTDYRYHMLRFIKNGKSKESLGRALGDISASKATREKGLSKNRIERELDSLKESNLIEQKDGKWKITDFGKNVLDITTKEFFMGTPPKKIEISSSSTSGRTAHYGPLTSTFFGKKSEAIPKILDAVDLHRTEKGKHRKQLIYGGVREPESKGEIRYYKEKGMLSTGAHSMSNFLRQGLIETERSIKWKGRTPSKTGKVSGRSTAAFFGSGDIYVHEFPKSVKEMIVPLQNLSRKEMKKLPSMKRGNISIKRKKKLTNFLKKNGLNPELAERLTVGEINVLWWLGKGKNNYAKIGKNADMYASTVKNIVDQLELKGFVTRRPMHLRVTFEKPETQRVINYLEKLEFAVQEEARKNPKFRKKFFGM